MSQASSISARIEALIHESAQVDPIRRERHKAIITDRLFASLVVLAMAPLYLALNGVPNGWAVCGFFWLMLSFISAAVLSRTGRLFESQLISVASFIGFGLTLGAGADLVGAGLAWLALAPIEAAFSFSIRLVVVASVGSALSALVLVVMNGAGFPHLVGDPDKAALLFGALAVVYAARLALRGLFFQRQSVLKEERGAAQLHSLSQALGELIMRHDRTGAVLFASAEAEQIFGLPWRDLMGRGFFDRVHVADRPAFLTTIADANACQRTMTAVLRLRTGSQSSAAQDGFEEPVFAWVELRARYLAAGEGEASVISIVRDVTALKMHELQIEEARAEAERAAAWKDRFLANVSHELRTPLNGIIGFSEILASDELAPRDVAKQREYAQIINSCGQHLLSVVNSILDMSKIEAGRFDIVLEPFELAPLLDSCCDIVRLKAEATGVSLVKLIPATLPELVADKRACKQILINLLSNAVKFTQGGGVVTAGARIEGNSVIIFVSDTGIGIGARDLPHIGDAFFQARSSYDRPYEGTGLGLSVVRGLVGLHGGTIRIESAPREGTCVTIRLPRDGRIARAGAAAPANIEFVGRASKLVGEVAPALSMVKKIA